MTWETTNDVERFLARAGRFLESDPVANNALLTEAHFWSWSTPPAPGGHFGWWEREGGVAAAFVHLPDHPVICSPLPGSAAGRLADAVPSAEGIGVEAADVEAVVESFASLGRAVRPVATMTLLRLSEPLHTNAVPEGQARPADHCDLPSLHEWFGLFQERHPEDRSDVAFVVDHPLADQGITLWERQGQPVAMASRTPRVAGMVRMGLAFQPSEGTAYADAAFDAACSDVARTVEAVLVLSGSPESTSGYRSRGFVPVLDRVLLHREPVDPGQM